MNKKTIRDLALRGKRVLARVDFNVPLTREPPYTVTDDTRIRAALPTIHYLLAQDCAVVLCSHLGRPKDAPQPEFSLRPVVPVLSALLGGVGVTMAPDCVGPEVERMAQALGPGQVLLLENTRFHPEEKKNDAGFARQLARLAQVYVNDAFGSAHRAHASTAGVAQYLPAVAGLLLEKELTYLVGALSNPARPFVAILGGAKISDKIGVVENLLHKADHVLIGGGMANTFLKAQGIAVGDSLVEEGALDTARAVLARGGERLALPREVVIADRFAADADHRPALAAQGIPAGWRILDIGPGAVEQFAQHLRDARLIVWNGPMGVFELAPFAAGTNAIARLVAESEATSIVGGGDSAAAIQQAGLADRITHISTGGGASLEVLESKTLPGVAALNDRG